MKHLSYAFHNYLSTWQVKGNFKINNKVVFKKEPKLSETVGVETVGEDTVGVDVLSAGHWLEVTKKYLHTILAAPVLT